MAGLAERRGPTADSFWTWREVMYRFLQRLSPDDVEAIAAFAYMEMLEAGFTTVGEFHYLHHDVDGRPYADLGEMAERIAAAVRKTRIGLTLLPSFYAYGGFGGAPPAAGQRRFINDPGSLPRSRASAARATVATLPEGRVGIAPHSLRAVTPDDAARGLPGDTRWADPYPCRRADEGGGGMRRRARPSAGGMAARQCRARFPLVRDPRDPHDADGDHARWRPRGAVAGLCPLTEASLGDGIFDGAAYLAAGGRFGIGTDSNIQIDAAAELRQLEYGQRLARRARNVMTLAEGESTGRRLYATALAGRRAGPAAADRRARRRRARRHRAARRRSSRSRRASWRSLARRLDFRRRTQRGQNGAGGGRDAWSTPAATSLRMRHRGTLQVRRRQTCGNVGRDPRLNRALRLRTPVRLQGPSEAPAHPLPVRSVLGERPK